MAQTDNVFELSPGTLVKEILGQRLLTFKAVYAEIPFLLVRISDRSGELFMGLSAAYVAAGSYREEGRADQIGFHTVQQSVMEDRVERKRSSVIPPVDLLTLKHRIGLAPHFIAELRKRDKAASYANRVSVGRARNQDVVLRHASVSKSHAWFEKGENGALLVADAGSKNGTWLRGERLGRRQLRRVTTGDEIRFGQVETTVCESEALWSLLNEPVE